LKFEITRVSTFYESQNFQKPGTEGYFKNQITTQHWSLSSGAKPANLIFMYINAIGNKASQILKEGAMCHK
jgi:hypothetical protein